MLAVFASAKLLAEIFERLKQPGIVGEILAGVLIGPQLLNWIAPNQVLSALSDLGLIFLLFRVGLEVKSSELLKLGGTALAVAASGIAFAFASGWGILKLWGAPQSEAIFMGAAMVATSAAIAAQVLAAKKLLDARASRIILAAAVFDDILGLLVLSLVSGMARDQVRPLELGLTAALAIGFTVIVAQWGSRTVHHILPRLHPRLNLSDAEFTLSVCLLFALSALAVYAGVAAIVGAFLAGMALSETVEQRVHDLTRGITELLTPFFLAGIGLHLDLRIFRDRATVWLALAIILAAIASKFAGCALGALPLGRRDAVRVGVGMIPRGEVGMVVAQLGLSMGVVTQNIYGVVVAMCVVTTLVAPPLLKLAYRSEHG
jgi:Kef-type K+ transport system membrane component KefB